MANLYLYMDRIQNEEEYIESSQKLKIIYKEIMRLIIKKEEYEKMIEEYLKSQPPPGGGS